ncbi:hypothetical protein ETU08_02465 [Apibacter muscae]|uniref:hypothetical protein n=1 Tax=Apibacter muscae TaxID=2509004 RepID=UPI0011AC6EBC|nr:hypothetical protein [Apibacter muscae]TWP30886.1 hypothetical protein ETU08_02465 [Apibacter muscae]
MKKVIIKAVKLKVVFLWLILILPITYGIYIIAGWLKQTVNQTYFIIFSLTTFLILAYSLLRKQMIEVTFSFKDNEIEIIEEKMISKNKRTYSIYYPTIKNYNLYHLILKKMGYIVRIEADKNYLYVVDWISWNKDHIIKQDDYLKLTNNFNKKNINRGKILIDYFILFLFYVPLIIIFLSIIVVVISLYLYNK